MAALHNGSGAKVGFEALDVGRGQRWLLARAEQSLSRSQIQSRGGSHSTCLEPSRRAGPQAWKPALLPNRDLLRLDGPRVGRYTFDAASLAQAIEVLKRASGAASDLLFVDEIGPLELEQSGGFAPVLDKLPLQGPGHVLLVVRPALLLELRRRLSGADFVVFTVTEENRDGLPRRIVQSLWPKELQTPNFKLQTLNDLIPPHRFHSRVF